METRHILGISGKDSATAAIVLRVHQPELWPRVELFYTDTQMEYPETYAWLDKVERYLDRPIQRIGGDLRQIITEQTSGDKPFLPSSRVRYCTKYSKLKPLKRWTKGSLAILYSGLRADEADRQGYTPDDRISVRHPLIEKNINLGAVYAILQALDLMPPGFFWPALYDRVSELWQQSNPLFSDFEAFLSPIQRRHLFTGRSRTNCFMCFFQRQYEYLWMYDMHRDLFEETCLFEERKDGYTWKQGYTIRSLIDRYDEILTARAQWVLKQIEAIAFGQKPELEHDDLELYAGASCGLFCGK